MKYRQQYDSSDCGAACFAMIASHYGLHLNIAKVRALAGTDNEGTNFKGLIDVAKKFNFFKLENQNFLIELFWRFL